MPTTSSPLPIIEDQKQLRHLGSLCVNKKEGQIALPLAAVDINAQVVSRVASVTVKQTFNNPYSDFLEAVYIFPMSGGVAVNKFEMKVGDRVIHGKVEERQEARLQYAQAIAGGQRAALMEQEREDVFTVSVGNLPPGEKVEITIVYAERLPYFHEGNTELRLPLVIGHRFIPGTPLNAAPVGMGTAEDTDLVPDASRITPPRLVPGVKADVALSIQVEVATDHEEISDLRCSQHATSTSVKNGWITVTLSREDEVMDRDFVLGWRMATNKISSRLHTFKSDGNGSSMYGMLTVLPPKVDGFVGTARDVVFVVDRSGSMRGVKMSSAIRACSILLETLSPRDRFAILAFDDRNEWMGAANFSQTGKFYDADEDGLERGHKFLRTIDARGGTQLSTAMESALQTIDARTTTNEMRAPVVVVLTDGEVGDESRVLKEIQQHLGEARVFTIGIDTAVNSGLLKRLAAVGGGTAAFVQPGAQLEGALINIGREIGVPLITDLKLEIKNMKLEELAPNPVPDLFAGRAVTVFFRMPAADKQVQITIEGKNQDGSKFKESLTTATTSTPAIAQLWAKAFVNQLEDEYRGGRGDIQALKNKIVEIAKSHSLLTKFTAFVIVDESEVVNKDGSTRTVVQPVSEPALWEQQLSMPPAFGGAPAPGMAVYRSRAASAPMGMPQLAPPALGQIKNSFQADAASQMASQSQSASAGYDAGGKMCQEQGGTDAFGTVAESIRKKLSGWGGGGGGSAPSKPPAGVNHQSLKQTASHSNTDSRADQTQLARSIHAFFRALEAVWTQVKAGQPGNGDELAKAREALLKQLAKSDAASELPELQRFVRVEAQELIAALASANATAANLQKLCASSEKVFISVKNEVASKLRLDATTGDTANFWEANI